MKIATSILTANNRVKCIKDLNNTNTDYIHIDIMDGVFVPNYQLPINEVNELAKYSNKPFDIHLMVDDPLEYIKKLQATNIKAITIHIEIKENIDNIIEEIKKLGYKVGIAIKPKTNIDLLNKYINKIDKVLVMSVEPGFGGQKFIDNSVDRIEQIRKKSHNIIIEVDGGINKETIHKIKDIADISVVGSYITNSSNYQKAINELKK